MTKKSKRVVITGMGVVTPLGNDIDIFWSNLVVGNSGIRKISRFDSEQFPTKIAGEVVDFDPIYYLDSKKANRMDRFVQFALAASSQAVSQSKIDFKVEDPYRIHVYIGTATAGQGWVFEQYEIFREKGYKKLNPFTAASTFPNAASSNIAIEFGIRGRCDTISSGCASSLNAIGYGYDAIINGNADMAIVGGSEAMLYAPIFGSYSKARVLSVRNGFPVSAPRPFDLERDGTILSEGAGMLCIEEMDHALKRNANILCEIAGVGFTTDAFHIIAHEPTGMIMAAAIHMALKGADLKPQDIDYIHMHGMGDKVVDKIETNAIKYAFGDYAYKLNTSAIKSMIGHTQGACGAIELIASIMSMNRDVILPTINLTNPDVDCDLNYTPNNAEFKKINHALVNTLGFGGKNASIIISKLQ